MAIYSIDSWLLPKAVRSYMPRDQVINKNFLGQDDERLNNGVIYVRVVDPCLMVHDDLGLTKWVTQTKSSFSFALNKGWNSISTNKKSMKYNLTEEDLFLFINNPDLGNQESLGLAVVKLKKNVNGGSSTTDMQEAAESSMMKKDEEGKKDTNGCSSSRGASASEEVIESSTTKK
ncbi:hypothetical protein ACFX13_034425 [Malus domestica]